MLEFEFDTGNLRKLAVVKILRGIDLEEVLSVFEEENKQVYPAKKRHAFIGATIYGCWNEQR